MFNYGLSNEIQKHLDNPDEPEALFKNEKGRKLACGKTIFC